MLREKMKKKMINQEKNKNIAIKRMRTKNEFKKTDAIKWKGIILQKKMKKSLRKKIEQFKVEGPNRIKKSN